MLYEHVYTPLEYLIHLCLFLFSIILFFFLAELCEVLKMFMANSEDVDLLDRAHIYHSLLVSLSNKKVCIFKHLLLFDFILPHVLAYYTNGHKDDNL